VSSEPDGAAARPATSLLEYHSTVAAIDPRALLLALVAPAGPGTTLAEGITLVGVSAELGLRWTLEVDGERVHVEAAPADLGRPHAVATKRLHLGYRLPPAQRGVRAAEQRGLRACRAIASAVARNEDAVLAPLAGPGAASGAATHGEPSAGRIRERRGGELLELGGTGHRRFYTLSPYVGCLVGCRFCYAQSRLAIARRFAGLPEVPWGSWVDVRIDAPETLARETTTHEPLPVKLCPIVSDPYQAVEARYGVVRKCLEVLRDAGWHRVLVLTRATLIRRDADVLAAMTGAIAGVSLPTCDDRVRAHFEPRAASVAERLETLRRLREAGVSTLAVVQPMLPGDPVALADAIAESCDHASLDVLHGEEGAGSDFDAYPEARSDAWQRERKDTLTRLLVQRGVALFRDELPDER
jgi:DNA repair photolyase